MLFMLVLQSKKLTLTFCVLLNFEFLLCYHFCAIATKLTCMQTGAT